MPNSITFSIVIPLFNEEQTIDALYKRLTSVMTTMGSDYEIIFVDDGSTDQSLGILKKIYQTDKRIRIVSLSRNFGQHIALIAGLDHAKGDAIILMDGDLQDPPEEILKLLAKFNEGYDIVYAIRKIRNDNLLKKYISTLFFKGFKTVANIAVPPNTGIFRIMSRRSADAFLQCREKDRLTIGLMSWTGFSHSGVATVRECRYAGKSKYNFRKSLKLSLDGIISFSQFPLKIATYLGFFIASTSAGIGIYILIKKIFEGTPVPGYASIIISVLFLGSIQLIMIGILGEYISRIYTEVQNRPLYIIKEKI